MIKMTTQQFLKEHIPLVRTLRSGSKQEQLKEAMKQDKEIKEKIKKKPKMMDRLNKLIGGDKEDEEDKKEKEEK